LHAPRSHLRPKLVQPITLVPQQADADDRIGFVAMLFVPPVQELPLQLFAARIRSRVSDKAPVPKNLPGRPPVRNPCYRHPQIRPMVPRNLRRKVRIDHLELQVPLPPPQSLQMPLNLRHNPITPCASMLVLVNTFDGPRPGFRMLPPLSGGLNVSCRPIFS